MFHFQKSVIAWPDAVARLPAGYCVKAIDNVQLLAEAKSVNPHIETILRHHYDRHQNPAATDEENENLARRFFSTFIDDTFRFGETHGWHHAAATDYVEGWNEYFSGSQDRAERDRFISWARAAAKVWATEFQTKTELQHIRLIIANTAIGNDIPLEVARAADYYGALLGYHAYWPVRDDIVPPTEWHFYSGRWTAMDKLFVRDGLSIEWAFTEAGAVGYSGNWPAISLGPTDGWRCDDVHGGNIDNYLTTITRWMNMWHSWNQSNSHRALPPVLFTSGHLSPWENFELNQPHLNQIAQHVHHWSSNPSTPPQPPSFNDALWQNSIEKQTLSFFPAAALQKRIFADGLVPVMSESRFLFQNLLYAQQAAEHLATGERRVYYCLVDDWNNIGYISSLQGFGVP